MASTIKTKMPVALITGCNSGVGLALSVMMAKTCKVYATMRSLEKRGDLDKAAVKAGVTANIKVIKMDVNSDKSVNIAFTLVLQEEKRIDILVNNAGYSVFGSVEMLTMEQVKAQFETNLFGVIRCQKAALPTMRKQRSGKIINVSSIGGIWGQPFNDVYCASKFALEGLAESQAALFRTFGVYVCSVEPGGIKTKFIQNAQKPDMSGLPEEYKAPIMSTLAAYQTGTIAPQTAEEVAAVIMKKAVACATPPLRIQTNAAIQSVFTMQLGDTTGEAGVLAAESKFLSTGDKATKSYIVYYFPTFSGRAQPLDMMLEAAGAKWSRGSQADGVKDAAVFAVPAVSDGTTTMNQTGAAAAWLGQELGFAPPAGKEFEAMKLTLDIADVWSESYKAATTGDKAFTSGRLQKWLKCLEAQFSKVSGAYLFGDAPCYVDFLLTNLVDIILFVYGPTEAITRLSHANTMAAYDGLRRQPKILAYMKAMPVGYETLRYKK